MEWQPIETAPKDGRYVDLWMAGPRNTGARQPDCWFANGQWRTDFGDRGEGTPEIYIGDKPTHWMHPPDAPK